MAELTHTNEHGAVHMVPVGKKKESERRAVASATVEISAETAEVIENEIGKKGDVLAVARVAGLGAIKCTSQWIPLCHPVRVVAADVAISLSRSSDKCRVLISVVVDCVDRTGVEMEAMTGASATALTVYDMVKGIDRGARIVHVQLEEKSGGRSGLWRRA